MLNCYFPRPSEFIIRDSSLPALADNEVLVRVDACGVCGTDVHIFHGNAPASFPLIPGHEFAGVVVDCGKKVKRLSINDPVAIDPNIACGYCAPCREGKINFCENLQAIGVTRNGGFAEYAIVPELQAYPLSNSTNMEIAAFAEPLSCCLHGADVIAVRPGERVIIVGGGPIGLMLLQLVKMAGALQVGLVEPDTAKCTLGKKLGADFTINPFSENYLEQVADSMQSGPDVLIECAGNSSALDACFQMAKTGSRILLFGLAPHHHHSTVHLQQFFKKELQLKSSLLNPFTFQRAITLLESGKIDLTQFSINRMQLATADFTSVFSPKPSVSSLKNILIPNH